MTTDSTDLTPTVHGPELIYHPATGEVLELEAAPAGRLFDELKATADLAAELGNHRRRVELELARRADARNERTVTLDGCDYTVNAPTEDVYSVQKIREEVRRRIERAQALVGHDDGAAELERQRARLLESLIVHPLPAAPPPRIDKRALSRLLKTDDREILGAIAAARERRPAKRTVTLKARAIEATAVEEA